jgi:hypothetical protein
MVESPVVEYSSTCNPKGWHGAVTVLPVACGMLGKRHEGWSDDGREAYGQRYVSRRGGSGLEVWTNIACLRWVSCGLDGVLEQEK